MRIININIFYSEGSTGKLVKSIHEFLSFAGHDSYVVYGRGKRKWSIENPLKIRKISFEFFSICYSYFTRILGIRFCSSFLETLLLIRWILKIKPDIVHLHCMNCNYVNPYMLIRFLAFRRINTVVTNHADITFTGNCDHAYDCNRWKTGCGKCPNLKEATHSVFFDNTALAWKLMYDSFSEFSKLWVTSVSAWTDSRARQSPFFSKAQFSIIMNGVDVRCFHYIHSNILAIKHGLSEVPFILHVTPDFGSPLKGGEYVIQLAKRLKTFLFIVVVAYTGNLDIPSNVLMVGHVSNQDDLAMYYSAAKLTLLTSKRETFSMVCAESLCCGTPIVGFKCGGPEEIALSNYSNFVEYGDLSLLESMVRKWMSDSTPKENISVEAISVYSSDVMCKKYLDLYSSIVNM